MPQQRVAHGIHRVEVADLDASVVQGLAGLIIGGTLCQTGRGSANNWPNPPAGGIDEAFVAARARDVKEQP